MTDDQARALRHRVARLAEAAAAVELRAPPEHREAIRRIAEAAREALEALREPVLVLVYQ